MSAADPLIAGPTTDLDRQVNAAYLLAVGDGRRRYVYSHGERVFVSDVRPSDRAVVVVSPQRWAVVIQPGGDETLLGEET